MIAPSVVAQLLSARWFAAASRAVLCLPYWWSGLAKLAAPQTALAEANGLGLRPAGLVVALTIAVQLGGSALLVLGRWSWIAAGALAVFTACATLVAHPFWMLAEGPEHFHSLNTFLEHLGLIGGFLTAAVAVRLEELERSWP